MAAGPQADWATAAARYPVTAQTGSAQFWIDFFDERPGVLHQLLGDLYLITKAHQQADRRGGRRSRNINGNLDELWGMLTPKFAVVPFDEALTDLMGEVSLRQFAKRIPMSHVQLLRLLRGDSVVVRPKDPQGSMQLLEAIARAGGVHPSYFQEWRELFVYNALHSMFERSPNLSIKVMKQLMGEFDLKEAG
jgi:transcriptional regulator with XRE-family HTH domain